MKMVKSSKSTKAGVSKKKTSISVDFEGVETQKRTPEGLYKAEVTSVEHGISENSGKPKLDWEFKTTAGPSVGATLYYTTSLQPQALFNLKGVLEALGVDVPDGAMDLDLKELVGMEVGVQVEHEVYEGKKRSRIVDFMPADETEADGEDGGSGEDGGEDQEISEETIMAMDEDELEALVKENEIEVDLDEHKTLKAKRKAVIDAIAEAGGEDGGSGEGGDEETAGYTQEQIDEMSKEDMAEVVKEHKLKVKLEGMTGAQRKQLVKALQKAELFQDAE